ncbi:hypothetical protein PseBG33_4777 [Pseudomonas synxantha BG33R]|uniref:hypothetical protein n=1 Tax=Pseudomonas synxantha TaxID=47883 RepID=UPI00025FFA55|nr:hypothetical protein [Pseudomonas synxantha]EIK73755.1 hypothetical protein PseBG33_4777 [Pseudomonas synxantha BG33R]
MGEPLFSKAVELEYQKKCYSQCVSIKRNALRALLDQRRLLSSDLLYQAVNYAVSHCELHRDSTLLGTLVEVFDERDYQLFLAYWFSERLGMKCSMDKGSVRFNPSGQPATRDLQFKAGVAEFLKYGLKRRQSDVQKAEKKNCSRRESLCSTLGRVFLVAMAQVRKLIRKYCVKRLAWNTLAVSVR